MRKMGRPELDGLFNWQKGCERDAAQPFLCTIECAGSSEEGMVTYVYCSTLKRVESEETPAAFSEESILLKPEDVK